MPIKIKVASSRSKAVAVRVQRPKWQQFLQY